jgi:hypothetical protein
MCQQLPELTSTLEHTSISAVQSAEPGLVQKDFDEAPYSLPSELNMAILKDVVSSERTAAEHHIRSLQEDPGHYHHFVNIHQGHSTLKIKALKPKQDRASKKSKKPKNATGRAQRQESAMQDAIENLVVSSIVDIEFWAVMESYVRQLRTLKNVHAIKRFHLPSTA